MKIQNLSIILVYVANILLCRLLKRVGASNILGIIGWYLIGLPIKMLFLFLLIRPVGFLLKRFWGQMFVVSFITSFVAWLLHIHIDGLELFSRNSILVLLVCALVIINFYLFRKDSKK
jgi:hypothetical protein